MDTNTNYPRENIDHKRIGIFQVAQKHGWPESLVWSQALVKANDFDRPKALQWGIRTCHIYKTVTFL
jgi:hypothetical protein